MLTSGRMLACMPMIIWSAWSVNFFAGLFVVMMTRCMKSTYNTCKLFPDDPDCWSDDDRNSWALFTMTMLGVGEILGGGVLGRIRDSCGNQVALIVLIIETLAAIGLVLAVNINDEYNATTWIMTFVWGFQDAGLNTLINCILGFEFESKVTPFGVYKFSQSLFIFAFSLGIIPVTDDKTSPNKDRITIYCCAGAAFSTLALASMLFFKYKPEEGKLEKTVDADDELT